MNLILFSLIFILFTFNTSSGIEEFSLTLDILPDFIGYLILWLCLEKRRINKQMNWVYTAAAVMLPITFLCFVGQIKDLFIGTLTEDARNTGWTILNWVLSGLNSLFVNFNDLFLLAGTLILAGLFFALLEYWKRTNEHKLQCTVCKIGMFLCGLAGLCHIGATIILLPFSWHWISYPLSLLTIVAAWFVMKDSQEMLTGATEQVESRRFGIKK